MQVEVSMKDKKKAERRYQEVVIFMDMVFRHIREKCCLE